MGQYTIIYANLLYGIVWKNIQIGILNLLYNTMWNFIQLDMLIYCIVLYRQVECKTKDLFMTCIKQFKSL